MPKQPRAGKGNLLVSWIDNRKPRWDEKSSVQFGRGRTTCWSPWPSMGWFHRDEIWNRSVVRPNSLFQFKSSCLLDCATDSGQFDPFLNMLRRSTERSREPFQVFGRLRALFRQKKRKTRKKSPSPENFCREKIEEEEKQQNFFFMHAWFLSCQNCINLPTMVWRMGIETDEKMRANISGALVRESRQPIKRIGRVTRKSTVLRNDSIVSTHRTIRHVGIIFLLAQRRPVDYQRPGAHWLCLLQAVRGLYCTTSGISEKMDLILQKVMSTFTFLNAVKSYSLWKPSKGTLRNLLPFDLPRRSPRERDEIGSPFPPWPRLRGGRKFDLLHDWFSE